MNIMTGKSVIINLITGISVVITISWFLPSVPEAEKSVASTEVFSVGCSQYSSYHRHLSSSFHMVIVFTSF